MEERTKLQWHPPFCAATELVLGREKGRYLFHREYPLTSKPIEMDMLIIDKLTDEIPEHEIAKIFRRHNIVEYKSPGASLNIDVYYKVNAYACLYKSLGKEADSIRGDDITVTFVREEKPRKLFKQLSTEYGCSVEKVYDGVYYVEGKVLFPTQFVITGELDLKKYVWLRSLTRNADAEVFHELVRQGSGLETQGENNYASSIFDLFVHANEELIRKEKEGEPMITMESFFLENSKRFQDTLKELERKDAELTEKDAAITERDAEVLRLSKEVERLQGLLAGSQAG